MDVKDLIVYRNSGHQKLLRDIAHLMGYAQGRQGFDGVFCGRRLTELVVKYGLEGDLWRCSLTFYLANDEDAHTTTYEIIGPVGGSPDELVREDCRISKALFDYGMRNLEPSGLWAPIEDYKPVRKDNRVFSRRVRNRIANLAVQLEEPVDAGEFQGRVMDFYRELDAGKLGLSKASRIIGREEDQPVITDSIINVEYTYFKNIVGYELQRQKLIENAEASVEGKETNNVLFFGDTGAGRFSSVKAAFNECYGRGPHITEAYKHQFEALPGVLEQTKDRNYKFIIYMDDLSFEGYRLKHKHLKAVLEGGLDKRPGNVLIYATLNRRHLIREKFSDKWELDDKLHNNDTVQEKLSLAAWFGVTIYYDSPDKRQFETIVRALADRHDLDIPGQELFTGVSKQELSHRGLSGRTTTQFTAHLRARRQVLCGTSFT